MPGTREPDDRRRTGPIVLVGFMGAGKTTVGQLLAAALGAYFVDLDAEIESAAGQSVPNIFRAEGESGFRDRERVATRTLAERVRSADYAPDRRIVVAVGGGWMERPELRRAIPASTLVWLDASLDTLRGRLGGTEDSRPMLDRRVEGEGVGGLLASRRKSYSLADVRVDTDGRTPDEVVSGILDALAG